jgi:hypothetical protein
LNYFYTFSQHFKPASMKKIIYTASFLALFTVAAKAQSSSTAQQEPKKESSIKGESMQSEVKKMPAQTKPAQPAQSAQPAQEAQPQPAAPKTRMAINEKGVPASKTTEAKTKKEAPAASPGQPTTTEKH